MAAFPLLRSRSNRLRKCPGFTDVNSKGVDDATAKSLASAAASLRQTEVDAAEKKSPPRSPDELVRLSIDELRAIANELNIPNRCEIVDQKELIAVIRRCL